MSKREDRARALAMANGDTAWEEMAPEKRDIFRRQAEREGFRSEYDPTDPADVVGPEMRSRLNGLALLVRAASDPHDLIGSPSCRAALSEMGVEVSPDDDPDWCSEEAAERLNEYPLCVEATTVFEVVIGTGGPDDRFLFECSTTHNGRGEGLVPGEGRGELVRAEYEIRRVLYRYSWTESAEVELTGEDREVAEAFARRVVPELVE